MGSSRRTVILLIIMLAAFLGLAARCVYLQIYRSGHYNQISLRQQQTMVSERPQRGVIVDSGGRILAASNRINTVFVEPRVIKDVKETASRLAELLDKPAHEICRIIAESKNPGYVKIAENISNEDYEKIGAARIPGVGVNMDWQRYYPAKELTSHVVGFASVEGNGLAGVELKYDGLLRGSSAESVYFADAARRPIRLKETKVLGNDGIGIVLTIDSSIQYFARSELLKQIRAFNAESGLAIVMNPDDGAILACVCLPDFDPENPGKGDPNRLRNRAFTDPFEPGSIIKPVVAAVALDCGAVSTKERIYCENGSYHGKGFGRIGEYSNHRYGNLTVREILIESSNIGMAKIGQKLGKERLYEGLKRFGFGETSGLEMGGESAGMLHPPKGWTGYSVTRIPFGQEISVTAIQMMRAFCTLANGGRPVQPYIVKAIVGNDGQVTVLKPPQLPGYIIKPETAEYIVQEALTAVVNEGTGKKAKLENWQVFGKTGTANIASSDKKGYEEDAYIASFLGAAPAKNPRVAVFVSIRRPDRHVGKGYTGGAVAAPVAAEIIKKSLTYMQ